VLCLLGAAVPSETSELRDVALLDEVAEVVPPAAKMRVMGSFKILAASSPRQGGLCDLSEVVVPVRFKLIGPSAETAFTSKGEPRCVGSSDGKLSLSVCGGRTDQWRHTSTGLLQLRGMGSCGGCLAATTKGSDSSVTVVKKCPNSDKEADAQGLLVKWALINGNLFLKNGTVVTKSCLDMQPHTKGSKFQLRKHCKRRAPVQPFEPRFTKDGRACQSDCVPAKGDFISPSKAPFGWCYTATGSGIRWGVCLREGQKPPPSKCNIGSNKKPTSVAAATRRLLSTNKTAEEEEEEAMEAKMLAQQALASAEEQAAVADLRLNQTSSNSSTVAVAQKAQAVAQENLAKQALAKAEREQQDAEARFSGIKAASKQQPSATNASSSVLQSAISKEQKEASKLMLSRATLQVRREKLAALSLKERKVSERITSIQQELAAADMRVKASYNRAKGLIVDGKKAAALKESSRGEQLQAKANRLRLRLKRTKWQKQAVEAEVNEAQQRVTDAESVTKTAQTAAQVIEAIDKAASNLAVKRIEAEGAKDVVRRLQRKVADAQAVVSTSLTKARVAYKLGNAKLVAIHAKHAKRAHAKLKKLDSDLAEAKAQLRAKRREMERRETKLHVEQAHAAAAHPTKLHVRIRKGKRSDPVSAMVDATQFLVDSKTQAGDKDDGPARWEMMPVMSTPVEGCEESCHHLHEACDDNGCIKPVQDCMKLCRYDVVSQLQMKKRPGATATNSTGGGKNMARKLLGEPVEVSQSEIASLKIAKLNGDKDILDVPVADAIAATSLAPTRKEGKQTGSTSLAAVAPKTNPTSNITAPRPSVTDKIKKMSSQGDILVKAKCTSKKMVTCAHQDDGSQDCQQWGEVECTKLWMASTGGGATGGPVWDLLSVPGNPCPPVGQHTRFCEPRAVAD